MFRPLLFALLLLPVQALHGAAPTLPEAFGPGIAGAAGGVARGSDLLRVELPSERYPDALCADGTVPPIFVRSASVSASRNKWVVFLQGGGSCNSGEDCHARWRGRDGNFGADKLSARFAPTGGMATGGIGGRDPRNPFATWNQVFVYYCSSDGWSGRARDQVVEANHQGVPTTYRLHLMGAHIVDAVFDFLRSGSVSYNEANGVRRTLPDLDQADTLLFAGSSAGGNGVRANADRIGEQLHAARLGCPGPSCPLTYAAVLDASYGLSTRELDHANTSACGVEDPANCSYERSMRFRWEETQINFRRGLADESCVRIHEARGDAWRCADDGYVIENHLTTPVFARADLQDRLVMGNTIETGFSFMGVPIDRALYGSLHELQLRRLPLLTQTEEPRPPGPLARPASFGPQCGAHEALQHNEPMFNDLVVLPDGRRLAMLNVLADWLAGRSPGAVVQSFNVSQPPNCTSQP